MGAWGIYLLDERSCELIQACDRGHTRGFVQEVEAKAVRLGEGMTGRVAASEEPIFVQELLAGGRDTTVVRASSAPLGNRAWGREC